MSDQSSQNSQMLARQWSSGRLHVKKYARKSKLIKKKSHQMDGLVKKKIKCQLYNKGLCTMGSMCSSSHSFIPDIAKKFCKLFLINSCERDKLCPYSHNTSRYPCLYYHIQECCPLEAKCPYSHQKIDEDFFQDYLYENIDFLIKTYKEQSHLSKKCLNFIRQKKVLQKQQGIKRKKTEVEFEFPFFLSLLAPQKSFSSTKQTQKNIKEIATKKSNQNSQKKNQKPFAIRLSQKNRPPIPERIVFPNQENEVKKIEKVEDDNQVLFKNYQFGHDDSHLVTSKLSQCIELSPEQKWNKVQPTFPYCNNFK